MNPSPEQILGEAHQQWLNNPVTQQFLVLLEKREAKYKNDIQESVLKESNVNLQERLRANISSIQCVMKMLTDTGTFVTLSTVKPTTE